MDLTRIRSVFVAFLLAALGWISPVRAQFIGYVSPQTVQQSLATTITCTGAAQTFAINNLGQTQHWLTISNQIGVVSMQAVLNGVDIQGNTYRISDVAAPSGGLLGNSGTVSGSGYFPKVQAVITCSPITATFSASYSGAWGTFGQTAGSYLSSQIEKDDFNLAAANANQGDPFFQTPFGSAAGTLIFYFSSVAGPANSSVQVNCSDSQLMGGSASSAVVFSSSVATGTSVQTFQVPDVACPYAQMQYISGGASTALVSNEYVFAVPGRTPAGYQYTHITATTATVVKGQAGSVLMPGFLHTLTVNLGAAGTISIFDLAGSACTGTPSTNTIAVITATATTLQTFTYDVNTRNGICVKASFAMDITVSSQ